MSIETMPDILTWSNMSSILHKIHDSYIEKLSDKLGICLGNISKHNSKQGEYLTSVVKDLSDDALMRVLTAPETSYRLLWSNRHRLNDSAVFLNNSFHAEMLRVGVPVTISEDIWTALGDIRFSPSGATFYAPKIEGLMPLDFDSPYATELDLNGMHEKTPIPRDRLDAHEQQLVLARIESARNKIRSTDSDVLNFVVVFTKALVLQKDPEAPESFSSGSSGQYVGRSVLANPQLQAIDEVEIAEGIVHEAIHSLLYMQEQKKTWVYDPELYGPMQRTVSPWTGNALALRPYLQASFVWYGLLNFWCMALAAGNFERSRVKERIAQAVVGFLGRPLLAQVADYSDNICPDLLGAVDQMQSQVVSSFDQVA